MVLSVGNNGSWDERSKQNPLLNKFDFNKKTLGREKDEEYFDADGNFVEYVRDKEVKDACPESIDINPMYMGSCAADDIRSKKIVGP
ncbi:unnamed protein product [Brassica oleracea]